MSDQTQQPESFDAIANEAHHEERKFFRDVMLRVLAQIVLQLRGLILLPIIAKVLGTEEYGIWTQINVTVTLLVPILTMRLDMAVVRYLSSKSRSEINRDFFALLLLIWAGLLVVCGLGFLFREEASLFLFGSSQYVFFVELFLVFLVTRTSYTFLLNFYRTSGQMKRYTALELMSALLEVALSLYLVNTGGGLGSVLTAFIFVEAMVCTVVLANIIRQTGLPRSVASSKLFFYIGYSLPLVISTFLAWVIDSSDRYFITHLLDDGLKNVAIYNASYSLGQLSVLFLWPLAFVLFPTISRLWEDKKKMEARRYLQNCMRYYLTLAVPSVLGLYLLSSQLLRFFASDEFVTDPLLVLSILLGILWMGITQFYIYVLHLTERTKLMSLMFVGSAILNVILNILLIPQIGIMGAALSTFLAYLVRMGFVVVCSEKIFSIGFDFAFFIKVLIAGLGMYGSLLLLMPHGIVAIMGTAILGAVIYFIILLSLRGISRSEIDLFRSLLRPEHLAQNDCVIHEKKM
ncbi:oligosaccharide flippase family protein [Candidatus Acetothermia bacterium]|nr:oligosaccharide flippase family protein [Candidatus Acetothermia bacterium]MBI3643987.1 oligosaccharide flippase family protein [Candidatus Acetothermia bacterium]